MRSSQAAVDLIVAEEVSSKAVYIKKYQKPEWPGGASGVTVGIGYDCGYSTAERIEDDWGPFLAPNMVAALQRTAGKTGTEGKAALAAARAVVVVPWDAAMHVFEKIDMPKWEAIVAKAIPHAVELPRDCFGVLTSIAYNRGASFSKSGDRYKEMRNIRAHVISAEWEKIPDEIRAMKRLWPNMSGLRKRRDREADLFEKGLREAHSDATDLSSSNRVSTGDDRTPDVVDVDVVDTDNGNHTVTPRGNDTPINVQPDYTKYNVEVEVIQKQLRDLNYHEVGDIDGKVGGKFVAGVAAFMTDRGKDPNKGKITPELKAELSAAKNQGWSRPIAPSRANATASDIAPKVESVNQTMYTKMWAYVLGVPSAAVGVFKSFFPDANGASSYITSVKDFFGLIPSEFYFLAIAGIAGLILYQAKKAQDATVKAYQRGEIN